MVTLPIKVYKDTWYNCVANVLIGILQGKYPHKNIENFLTNHINGNYFITPSIIDDYFDTWHLNKGYFSVQVHYNVDVLFDLFDKKDNKYINVASTFEFVRESITNGDYCSIPLDRYYFPNGVDHNNYHLVHPVFIYGYDDLERVFYIIDDVMAYGNQDYYKLPYEDFIKSVISVFESGIEPFIFERGLDKLRSVKLKGFSEDVEMTKDNCKNNFEKILKYEKSGPTDINTYKLYGIEAIAKYAEIIEQALPELEDVINFKFISSQPLYLQKKNIDKIHFLHSLGVLDNPEHEYFSDKFITIYKQWELFRNKAWYYIEKGIHRTSNTNKVLAKSLTAIYSLEKETYLQVLEKLK